jgi:hypothetical protein
VGDNSKALMKVYSYSLFHTLQTTDSIKGLSTSYRGSCAG